MRASVNIHADPEEDVTYKSGEARGEQYEVIRIGWDTNLFFTDPAQLDALSSIASEAAASLRTSLGFVSCDWCAGQQNTPLVTVKTEHDQADVCESCAALASEAA